MKYYNIHTHERETKENIVSIYNLTPEEILGGVIEPNLNTYFSAGIHPWNIEKSRIDISSLKQLINSQKIVAIGEAGLDKLIDTPLDTQADVFRAQIELAEDSKLPLIVHCVKAWDELTTLHKEYRPSSPWIIHGFRGGKQLAKQLKRLGLYFSIGEYYNVEALSEIYPSHMFIETDESSMGIEGVYEKIARDLNCIAVDLQSRIEQNVSFVFDLSK